jgi:outer membrane lipoprotein-sorting protein
MDEIVACLRLAVVLLALPGLSWAQASAPAQGSRPPQAQVDAAQSKDLNPDEIIRRFSAKETEFYEAWMQYTYHQTADVRIHSVNGVPKSEQMTTISDVVFKDDGSREVQVRRRMGNLRSVIYTMEDEEVINNLQPFALTEKELREYTLDYQGKEKVDELSCYVFSVRPKSLKGNRLFFEGKIWVDDQDLQIVRTVGKPVPQKKNNQFPEFETIRQMIDNQYWFPVWTHAESHLHFSSDTVHIEETINYADYKRFASKTTIQYETPVK